MEDSASTNASTAVSARRMQDLRSELIERIARIASVDGVIEPLPGVHLARVSRPLEPLHVVYCTALCLVAQGAKEVGIGQAIYRYDPGHYLLSMMALPAVSRVLDATRERPYLSLRVDLDAALVGALVAEAGMSAPMGRSVVKAVGISSLDPDLLDACVRLVRLAETPAAAAVLAPMVKREIVFRLLLGDQGDRLRRLPALAGHTQSIGKALSVLRTEFDRPLRMEAVAAQAGMSASAFYQHFRAITDMSPLQFQKQLRLQHARRLMLGEGLDAATAAYRVGYSDASHFSREYRRYFREPPARDIRRLRNGEKMRPADPKLI